MLQRQVKQGEETTRKWRHRFFMVEKDVKRSEKLLASFTGRESMRNSKTNAPSEIDDYLKNNKHTFQATGDLGLSGMARGFQSYDDGNLIRGSSDDIDVGTPSAFMEALMFGESQKRELRSGGGISSSLSSVSSSNRGGKHSRYGSERLRNNERQKFLSPLGKKHKLKKTVSKLARGTVADGMKIAPLDSYADILVNNNRRPTAYGRSVERDPQLWPPLEESRDDGFF